MSLVSWGRGFDEWLQTHGYQAVRILHADTPPCVFVERERHSAEPLFQDTWTSAKPIFYLDYIFISYYNRKVKNVVFHQTFKKKRGTHCEKIRRIYPEYS